MHSDTTHRDILASQTPAEITAVLKGLPQPRR